MYERSLEMVVGMLGILKAGGAYVPLDLVPDGRLAFMLRCRRVRGVDAGIAAGRLPVHWAQRVSLDRLGRDCAAE